MQIIKNQSLGFSEVRQICIRENLFTRGTENDYYFLSKMVISMCQTGREIPTDNLCMIAEYIAEHSDYSAWKNTAELEYADFVAQIMYWLYKEVRTAFEIIEG